MRHTCNYICSKLNKHVFIVCSALWLVVLCWTCSSMPIFLLCWAASNNSADAVPVPVEGSNLFHGPAGSTLLSEAWFSVSFFPLQLHIGNSTFRLFPRTLRHFLQSCILAGSSSACTVAWCCFVPGTSHLS